MNDKVHGQRVWGKARLREDVGPPSSYLHDDLKMVSQPKPKAHQESPNDLFIHSSLLILVDKDGQVRASFESDAPNLADQIKKALTQLAPWTSTKCQALMPPLTG